MTTRERNKILKLSQSGMTVAEIADKTEIPRSTVHETIQKYSKKSDSDEESSENEEEDQTPERDTDTPPEDYNLDELEEESDEYPEDDTPPQDLEAITQEVSNALRDEYEKILKTFGEVNRNLLQDCTTGFDRATRMLQESTKRLDEIEAARKSATDAVTSLPTILKEMLPTSKVYLIHLLLSMMAFGLTFCAGGLFGLCDFRTAACITFALLLGISAALFIFYVVLFRTNETFAWCVLSSMALPGILFAGYCFFLMGPAALRYWLWPLLAFPAVAAVVSGILYFHKSSKEGEPVK